MRWLATIVAVAACAAAATPASARVAGGGPVAVASKLPATIAVSVPPGGSANVGSPPLDGSIRSMALDVAPSGDQDAFDSLRLFLADIPTPGKRLMACAFIFRGIVHGIDTEAGPIEGDVEDEPLATLFMAMCAQLAVSIDSAGTGANSAASGCLQQRRQVAVRITRTGSTYSGSFSGSVKATKRPPMRITCKPKGKGYTLRVSPRRKGAKLRRVAGSRLRLGFQSPADSTGSAKMRVTFRR